MTYDPKLSLDPEKILEKIKQICERRKEIYDNAPITSNIKIELITERCESPHCPFDHTFIKITADYMMGNELLNICRYVKRNKIPLLYRNNSFYIILN
jgi:hypothetical protein